MTRTKQPNRKKYKAAVAAIPPHLAYQKGKKKAMTKKQLVQHAKAEKRKLDQANREDIASLYGPLSSRNKKSSSNKNKGNDNKGKNKDNQNKSKKKAPKDNYAFVVDGDPIHHGGKNNKKNKKKRSKNPPFQLKTIRNPANCRVPWWTEDHKKEWRNSLSSSTNNNNNNKKRSNKRHYLFGHQHPHEAWMAQLDAELNAFASYVQISADEIAARNFVVKTLETITQNNLDCVPQGDQASVQIFGSFATPPVCAFCSDVDMALHGVVPPEEEGAVVAPKQNQHLRFEHSEDAPSDEDSASNQKVAAKKARVNEWRQLLNEAYRDVDDDDNDSVDDDDDGVVVDEQHLQQDSDDAHWQNHLEQLLEHANEGPDYRGRSDSCASAELGSKTTTNSKDVVDLTEEEDKKPAAKEDPAKDENDSNEDSKPAAKASKEDNGKDDEGEEEFQLEENFFVVDRVGAEVIEVEDEEKKDDDTTKTKSDEKDNNKTEANVDDEEDDNDEVLEMQNARKRVYSVGSSGSDSEDDTADKLASLKNRKEQPRKAQAKMSQNASDSKRQRKQARSSQFEDAPEAKSRFQDAEQAVISLSSDDGEDDDDDIHVCVVNKPAPNSPKSSGPQGAIRVKVVNALGNLGNILQRRRFTQSVQVIRKARVPIVKFETKLGFEGDVAMGGHSGTDTSQCAMAQVAKFKSFATVVMVLKILLRQHGLDTPFHGGLGSFKLYVLVAHHLERHLELGGSDRPGEVFLSFLFRYGWVRRGIGILDNCDSRSRTLLQMNTTLGCADGYEADMSACFLVRHCVELFRQCFMKIGQENVYKHAPRKGSSILLDLFDVQKLIEDRTESMEKAALLHQFCKATKKQKREEQERVQKKQTRGKSKLESQNKRHKSR